MLPSPSLVATVSWNLALHDSQEWARNAQNKLQQTTARFKQDADALTQPLLDARHPVLSAPAVGRSIFTACRLEDSHRHSLQAQGRCITRRDSMAMLCAALSVSVLTLTNTNSDGESEGELKEKRLRP